jgi:preprotein translocase subunit SecB
MKLSPLQAETIFFTHLQIESNPSPDKQGAMDIEAECECKLQDEKARRWTVVLTLKSENTGANYLFNIQLFGGFQVHKEYPADKVQQLVEVNGPAVLFGVAREMLHTITNRGPHAKIILPTVNFIDNQTKPHTEDKKKKATSKKALPAKREKPAMKKTTKRKSTKSLSP